ncbi:hypothetical protein B0O99DRAFT_333347 [Bisporella sp. PMI_857]|nr:hypothetical protein B0O99DRAFT_333347 [Bisporella sp. PMI_857]
MGFGSTVWLAEDIYCSMSSADAAPTFSSAGLITSRCKEEPKPPRYVVIEIGTCACGGITAAENELRISKRIITANLSHPGSRYTIISRQKSFWGLDGMWAYWRVKYLIVFICVCRTMALTR